MLSAQARQVPITRLCWDGEISFRASDVLQTSGLVEIRFFTAASLEG
jgi:hypothetical protein